MKCFSNSFSLLLFFFQLLNASAQNNLTIRYALSAGDYKETQVPREQNSAYFPKTKKGEKLYRFFSPGRDHEVFSSQISKRHEDLYQKFRQEYKGQDVNQVNFANYAKDHDSYYYTAMGYLAPAIKFDFIGATKEYVLDSIEIEVLGFEEYRGGGGGFFNDDAYYDILLPHRGGTRVLAVGKKLRFNGSGSATLRFWSDNFYQVVGFCPMGCYTINIKFHFLSDNRKVVVASGLFKIDV